MNIQPSSPWSTNSSCNNNNGLARGRWGVAAASVVVLGLLPIGLASCKGENDTAECGNGEIEDDEECDNGDANGSDNMCSAECTVVEAVCGDGVVQTGEVCDDGNSVDDDACSNACELTATCGDGVIQDGEECDEGPMNSDDAACTSACANAYCGDGLVGPGETCDDANSVDNDECTNMCDPPDCGNGVLEEDKGEECDDGNMDDTDECTNTCTVPVCGDAFPEGAEGCDDGNTDNTDECTTLCQPPSCDDGLRSGDEVDVDCGGSSCGACFGMSQHTWKGVTEVGQNWRKIDAADYEIQTRGGPLEIELSIPLVGGGDSACRPTVDGEWAGSAAELPQTYQWHEGRERTGWNSPHGFRLWKRMRVYYDIPAGKHMLGVECVTSQGADPLYVGREGSSSVILTREYDQVDNRVHQKVSLMEMPGVNQDLMVELPDSELYIEDVGGTIEVAISVPIGHGSSVACLPWMDDVPIPSEPLYTSVRWDAGVAYIASSWTLWTHSRTYSIPQGDHTFDIRCHGDSAHLNAKFGELNAASVIIVREIDNIDQDVGQGLDPHANGYEINYDAPGDTWKPLLQPQATVTVKHGTLDVTSFVNYGHVNSYEWLTCRPTYNGEWLGVFSTDEYTDQEEGVVHQLAGDGSFEMWYRRRLYTGVPTGTYTIALECMSSGSEYYVGYYGQGTLTVRDVPLIQSSEG